MCAVSRKLSWMMSLCVCVALSACSSDPESSKDEDMGAAGDMRVDMSLDLSSGDDMMPLEEMGADMEPDLERVDMQEQDADMEDDGEDMMELPPLQWANALGTGCGEIWAQLRSNRDVNLTSISVAYDDVLDGPQRVTRDFDEPYTMRAEREDRTTLLIATGKSDHNFPLNDTITVSATFEDGSNQTFRTMPLSTSLPFQGNGDVLQVSLQQAQPRGVEFVVAASEMVELDHVYLYSLEQTGFVRNFCREAEKIDLQTSIAEGASASITVEELGVLENSREFNWLMQGKNARGEIITATGILDEIDAQIGQQPQSAASIFMSYDYSCTLDAAGQPHCWGDNTFRKVQPPQANFVDLALSSQLTCGIEQDGDVTCWGDGISEHVPKQNVSDLAMGYEHSVCAIDTMGGLACWRRDFSQFDPVFIREEIPGSFVSLSSYGGGMICAVDTSAQLQCWNTFTTNQWFAIPLSSVASFAGAHYQNICVRTTAGALACWEETNGETSPVPADIAPMKQLSISNRHACGIDMQDRLRCWSTFASDLVMYEPWDAAPTGTFVSVTSENDSFCAIRTGGELECWSDM